MPEQQPLDVDRRRRRVCRFVAIQLPIFVAIVGAGDYALGGWGPALTAAGLAVIACVWAAWVLLRR